MRPKSGYGVGNHVKDTTRRAQLESAYQQTEVPLVQAIQVDHQFVYDDMRERLATARQRLDALLEQVANPKP